MKSNFRYLLMPLLGLSLLLVGCRDEVVQEAPTIRPAHTYTVPQAAAEVERSFSGQLYAAKGAELSFEVSGRVTELVGAQGTRYDAGTVLARVDDFDFLARQNDVEALFAQATQELRRVQRLYESENASQSELDAAVANEISSRANFQLAQRQTDNAVLKMPYTGVIASVEVDVQQVVSAGQAIFRVQGEGPMEFEFGVPSNIVTQIEPGLNIEIGITDVVDSGFQATVTKVAPSSDQNTTYLVTAVLDGADDGVREGMDGEAILRLPGAAGPNLVVPLSCIMGGSGDQSYVWLVTESAVADIATVSKQAVAVGVLLADGYIEILDGLQAGQQILSRGVHQAEAGMSVRVLSE